MSPPLVSLVLRKVLEISQQQTDSLQLCLPLGLGSSRAGDGADGWWPLGRRGCRVGAGRSGRDRCGTEHAERPTFP